MENAVQDQSLYLDAPPFFENALIIAPDRNEGDVLT